MCESGAIGAYIMLVRELIFFNHDFSTRLVPILRSLFLCFGRSDNRVWSVDSYMDLRNTIDFQLMMYNNCLTRQDMLQFRRNFYIYLDNLFPIKTKEVSR